MSSNVIREIKQLLPAPGWQVWYCVAYNTEPTVFWQAPVIGWAIVDKRYMDGEREVDRESSVELIIFDPECGSGHSVYDEFSSISNAASLVISPLEKFTDVEKAELESIAKLKLANSEKKLAKEKTKCQDDSLQMIQ